MFPFIRICNTQQEKHAEKVFNAFIQELEKQ